jgi:hypothetical protein
MMNPRQQEKVVNSIGRGLGLGGKIILKAILSKSFTSLNLSLPNLT